VRIEVEVQMCVLVCYCLFIQQTQVDKQSTTQRVSQIQRVSVCTYCLFVFICKHQPMPQTFTAL
jgi:hypothetical protein